MRTASKEYLRGPVAKSSKSIGVDREAGVIRGYVVAQLGPFKTPGRGEFDEKSLSSLVDLGNAAEKGIRVRFTHPNLSSDGLGTYLGRAKDFRLDGDKVRADLNFDKTAKSTPRHGNLQKYVEDLAESDPDAFSSSIVVVADKKFRRDEDGAILEDQNGDPLPPIWRPTELRASDVVDTGDAVDGFLSMPDDAPRYATEIIDQLFGGEDRETVEARCLSFVDRYLANKYGEKPMADTKADDRALQLAEQNSKQIEALTALIKQGQEELAAEKTRVKDIAGLCKLAKVDAAEFIADESLSVNDVRDKLLTQLSEKRQLPEDGDSEDLGKKKEDDPDARFKLEYQEHAKLHKSMGVSEEDFCSQRRIEEGIEEAPVLLG